MKYYMLRVLTLLVCLLLVASGGYAGQDKKAQPSGAAPTAGEQIDWQVISSGGGEGGSTNFIVNGTAGQTATGAGTSSSYGLSHGFWQSFVTGCCVGITGNVDGDPGEIIDIGDVTALLDYLYIRPGVEPPDCMPEANVDGDPGGIVDIGDVTALLDYLYIRPGVEPPAPCP